VFFLLAFPPLPLAADAAFPLFPVDGGEDTVSCVGGAGVAVADLGGLPTLPVV